jgi:hypothetical protein
LQWFDLGAVAQPACPLDALRHRALGARPLPFFVSPNSCLTQDRICKDGREERA